MCTVLLPAGDNTIAVKVYHIIFSSMVKSLLIYRAETWSLYEDDRRRINATEMATLTL